MVSVYFSKNKTQRKNTPCPAGLGLGNGVNGFRLFFGLAGLGLGIGRNGFRLFFEK